MYIVMSFIDRKSFQGTDTIALAALNNIMYIEQVEEAVFCS